MGTFPSNAIDAPGTTGSDGRAQVDAGAAFSAVSPELQLRVVREARRETWFVVNSGATALAALPLPLGEGRSVRRCHVNGEIADFTASGDTLIVTPQRSLRAGAGTIVVVNFR